MSDGEKTVLDYVNGGRALRGAEPLGAAPSFFEPLSPEDEALADRFGEEMKGPPVEYKPGQEELLHQLDLKAGRPWAVEEEQRRRRERRLSTPTTDDPQEEDGDPQEVKVLEDQRLSSRERPSLGGASPLGGVLASPLGGVSRECPPLGGTGGVDLEALDLDPRMVAVAVGAPLSEGELIRCVIPGHDGEGTVARKPDGRFTYRCTCDGIERGLTEAYVGRVTGDGRKRSTQEFVLWRLRQAVKAEIVELPAPVPIPALPEKCAASIVACHRGVALLLRIRGLTEQRDQTTFTFARRFAAEWSGLDKADQAKDGIAGLIRLGVLVKVGEVQVSAKRSAALYALGGGVTELPDHVNVKCPGGGA